MRLNAHIDVAFTASICSGELGTYAPMPHVGFLMPPSNKIRSSSVFNKSDLIIAFTNCKHALFSHIEKAIKLQLSSKLVRSKSI